MTYTIIRIDITRSAFSERPIAYAVGKDVLRLIQGENMKVMGDADAVAYRAGRPQKYPWDQWLQAHKKIRLFRGDDFDVSPDSLRPQIHAQAKRRHGTVSTTIGREDGQDFIEIVYMPPVELDFEFDKTEPAA